MARVFTEKEEALLRKWARLLKEENARDPKRVRKEDQAFRASLPQENPVQAMFFRRPSRT
ncbi:MAG: hypothetical protein UY48_C0002G0042 [Candidatus Gottesmanbacteria bacterium GW2011_GWB1_49_7]|uniref:Uncharacterized protein n=1 Tax=Candidatus Gottesmanbacteria bacterium GW2011_GWB1_49_7 TaxID=1618448 RepID=A0A0G1W3K7_9BACT|nr:MAG: hypothetical protein UY48_C0002G0042 [Candidatus Gottesmanbacteria bacterium GW2011_GWB1_49_7]